MSPSPGLPLGSVRRMANLVARAARQVTAEQFDQPGAQQALAPDSPEGRRKLVVERRAERPAGD